MIHEALKKTIVAKRYYEITAPHKKYINERARKQLDQDVNIDLVILKGVIDKIYLEQLELIQKEWKIY